MKIIKTKSCQEFVESKILELFSEYYVSFVTMDQQDTCSWDDLLKFSDPNQKHGVDYWIATVQLWGSTSREDAEFFGTYIFNKIHGKKKKTYIPLNKKAPTTKSMPPTYKSKKAQRKKSRLSLADTETIMSLATVMVYSFYDKRDFHNGIKKSLENYLLDLAS